MKFEPVPRRSLHEPQQSFVGMAKQPKALERLSSSTYYSREWSKQEAKSRADDSVGRVIGGRRHKTQNDEGTSKKMPTQVPIPQFTVTSQYSGGISHFCKKT